jgi:hypothetical protein
MGFGIPKPTLPVNAITPGIDKRFGTVVIIVAMFLKSLYGT